MSIHAHIETLEAKHADLDQAITHETNRPLPDFVHITGLKKQKLRVKEEIARLYAEEGASYEAMA